jgi:hypothetical protein
MSTVLARRVASTPARTASQTWSKITEILAPDPASAARAELRKAAGVACASISSEAPRDAAIVVWGAGPRVRVYCIFDEDAITGEDVSEDALAKSPTDGDWRMSIPCLPEDVMWSSKQLASVSTRISARATDEDVEEEETDSRAAAPAPTINLAEFLKP